MAKEDGLSSAERELESALKSLAPVAGGINLVHAAYQAGRRSERRRVRIWQGMTLAAAVACVFVWLPIGQVGQKSAVVDAGKPLAAGNGGAMVVPVMDQDRTQIEQAVLDRGLDALPPLRLPDFSNANSDETF